MSIIVTIFIVLVIYLLAEVENIELEVLSDTSVRISWDNSGFQAITDFVVYYRQTGSRKRQTLESSVVVSKEVTSITINNLVSAAEYVFEVVARATDGQKSVSGMRAGPDPLTLLSPTTERTSTTCSQTSKEKCS